MGFLLQIYFGHFYLDSLFFRTAILAPLSLFCFVSSFSLFLNHINIEQLFTVRISVDTILWNQVKDNSLRTHMLQLKRVTWWCLKREVYSWLPIDCHPSNANISFKPFSFTWFHCHNNRRSSRCYCGFYKNRELWLLQEQRSAHFGLRDSYIIRCIMFLVYARWQEIISPISN